MIPKAARNCAFCSARQEVPSIETPTIGGKAIDEDATGDEDEATPPAAEAKDESAAARSDVAPEATSPATASPPTVEKAAPPGAAATRASAEPPPTERAAAGGATAAAAAGDDRSHDGEAPPPSAPGEADGSSSAPHRHASQTSRTLVGIEFDAAAAAAEVAAEKAAAEKVAAEKAAAEKAATPEPSNAAAPATAEPAAAEFDAVEPDAVEPEESDAADNEPGEARAISWAVVGRTVMALAGVVLLALYVSSYKLMVAFAGPEKALQHFSLAGGLVLVAAGLMHLPPRFRAGVATGLGAVPLFLVGPSLVGFDGWRGPTAALVFLVLPGALLLRARATDSRLARALVAGAVALIALLYLVPSDGVAPITAALALLGSGSLVGALTGAIFLSPLLLGALALTAFAGRDSTGFGALWACLVLLLAPGALIAAGLTDGDASLVHVGVALLAAGATAAVGLAQLLAPSPQGA